MHHGTTSNRSNFLWPPGVIRPEPTLKIVYLDLNHWIYLAKAASGSDHGRPFQSSLNACRNAKDTGTAIFVLSALHYMELTKISDPAQRRQISRVMEELSDFTTLLDRALLSELEVEALLDSKIGSAPDPYIPVKLLGTGLGHAFGMQGGFHIRNSTDGSDASEVVRSEMGEDAYDELVARVNQQGERMLLSGPEDADLPDLIQRGYQQDAAERAAAERAEQENQQAQRHQGTQWARGDKLFDIVSVRELTIELIDFLNRGLFRRGITDIQALISDKESARNALASMPIAYTSVLLKTEQHRNPTRPWQPNDIFDIDAMSHAVPYCDIVVTEKHRWNDLRKAKLDQRLNTVVLRSLADLTQFL